jgi:hypothetical protein
MMTGIPPALIETVQRLLHPQQAEIVPQGPILQRNQLMARHFQMIRGAFPDFREQHHALGRADHAGKLDRHRGLLHAIKNSSQCLASLAFPQVTAERRQLWKRVHEVGSLAQPLARFVAHPKDSTVLSHSRNNCQRGTAAIFMFLSESPSTDQVIPYRECQLRV